MNLRKFIHRHYETIKLVLLIIIASTMFFILYVQTNNSRLLSEQAAQDVINREHATAKLLEAEKAKTDLILENQEKQTKLTTCLLVAHGERVAITPEDEEACRILVEEAVQESQIPEAPKE